LSLFNKQPVVAVEQPQHATIKKFVNATSIMVVEDEPLNMLLISEVLHKMGFAVIKAGNGREAIEWFKGRQTFTSLIFLDLIMPVLDGWGFLLERRQNPAIEIIPVVVMSGSLGIADRAKAAGAVHVMRKPFGAEELLPVIQRFLVAA